MDPVFVTEVAVVGVAALGVLALVVRSVLRRRRHGRADEDWTAMLLLLEDLSRAEHLPPAATT